MKPTSFLSALSWVVSAAVVPARADVVTEWNVTASDITAAAKVHPPAAYRAMALVQTAVLEAANAPAGASLEAAVAAANRVVLLRVAPSQQEAIERAYERALALVPDGRAEIDGVAAGERAALAVLERRAADDVSAPEAYRPATEPGVYVATAVPVASSWPNRAPWALASAAELRPGPPPSLDSEPWIRDLREVRRLGARNDSARTPEQTAIARFWEATMPSIYFSAVRSAAAAPGRDAVANARLLAIAAQAMDDALIACFDAKYHYGFWRPITAIRNADLDGSAETEREAAWLPLVDTPMHPEYPAAHCSLAGAIGAVLAAELGTRELELSSSSPTAPGVVRSWSGVDAFVAEVAEARVCDGVHFRNSTAVGTELGRKVGERVVARFAGTRQ